MTCNRCLFVARMAIALGATWIPLGSAEGAPIMPGNLIATVNEFTGSSPAPTYVAEYSPSGVRVQILANVPAPGGSGPTSDEARDLVVGPGNAIYVYNGTFDPFLARLDGGSSTWTQQTFAGWSTVNNLTFGGLARLDEFLYATDMRTFGPGDEPSGIVRFDTAGGPTVRFAETIEPIDVTIGADRVVYALPGAGLPNDTIFRFDATSLAALGTVPIQFADNRALAVAADGSIFVASFDGAIRRYSPTGILVDSLTVPGAHFADIDIDPSGRIALGTGFDGEIVLTDLALDVFNRFRATESTFGGEVFVSWVPQPAVVPEPSCGALLALGLIVLSGHLRKRRGGLNDRGSAVHVSHVVKRHAERSP